MSQVGHGASAWRSASCHRKMPGYAPRQLGGTVMKWFSVLVILFWFNAHADVPYIKDGSGLLFVGPTQTVPFQFTAGILDSCAGDRSLVEGFRCALRGSKITMETANGKREIPIWEVGIIRITNTASNVDNLELNFITKYKTVLNGVTFENKFVFNVRRLLSVPKKWTGRIFIEDFDASRGVVFFEN